MGASSLFLIKGMSRFPDIRERNFLMQERRNTARGKVERRIQAEEQIKAERQRQMR